MSALFSKLFAAFKGNVVSVDFFNADMTGAKFKDASFQGNMQSTNLERADLSGARLYIYKSDKLNFTSANMTMAKRLHITTSAFHPHASSSAQEARARVRYILLILNENINLASRLSLALSLHTSVIKA